MRNEELKIGIIWDLQVTLYLLIHVVRGAYVSQREDMGGLKKLIRIMSCQCRSKHRDGSTGFKLQLGLNIHMKRNVR